jgi:hypothetical protein
MVRLLPLFREAEFFKKRDMDDRTLIDLIGTSKYMVAKKGEALYD